MRTQPIMTAGPRADVVFLDIDGTLIQKGADTVPAPTRRAVAATVAKGITVLLATQRPLVDVLSIAEHLRLGKGSYVIASNGAATVELTGNRRPPFDVVHCQVFDPWAALTVAMAVAPGVAMAVEQIGTGWRVNRPFAAGELNGLQHVVNERVLWSEYTTHAVVHGSGIAHFAPQIEGAGFTATPTASDRLDITARGQSKATAALDLRHRWKTNPQHTAAIGDHTDDIALLHQVQHGFAMGQAPQAVKDAADYVTATIDQHGAAMALDSLTHSKHGIGPVPILAETETR